MDIQKKDSSRILEPDLIVSGDKVLYMSEGEQRRFTIACCAHLARFLASTCRRGV